MTYIIDNFKSSALLYRMRWDIQFYELPVYNVTEDSYSAIIVGPLFPDPYFLLYLLLLFV